MSFASPFGRAEENAIKGPIRQSVGMNSLDLDVAIIGAGPSGLLAAVEVARHGHSCAVFEEHPNVGEPDHCAGLLSTSGLKSLRLRPPKDVIQNYVSGARIYSPSGQSILIERGKREAFAVDRRKFDLWLAEKAQDAGAEVLTQHRVEGIKSSGKNSVRVHLRNGDGRFGKTAIVAINAEGSRCVVSRKAGLPTVKKQSFRVAYQFEVKNAEIEDDSVEMFYGRKYAPGFFVWLIPIGDNRARVGLAARDKAKTRLQAAIRHHPILKQRLRKSQTERGFGGAVLVGMPIPRTYADGIMITGDAAGLVKPTTGGGVILGGTAARMAGSTAAETIMENDSSERVTRLYEKRWKSLLLSELRTMYLAQRLISGLGDKGLDSVIGDAYRYGLVDIVEREGDMDMQQRTITRLMRDPRMFAVGLKAIRYLNPFL
ncbi:MAG: NAD(P)/FAD-dependent oxidoreductase [Candidatus Thorarchaeota archaeon]|nr:MAG: NAD(P)/FAD-dependent oxidoreductase [Candidatus Thorarchaeota archaeon]